MLEILPKILVYKMFRAFGFPKMLPMNYTVSLLYTCNSRCKTCNVWKKSAENLKLWEYKKIFKSIGKSPYWITFSGGEPFLRKEIVEICKAAYDICKPKIINIPTNGLLTDTIVKKVNLLASSCPKTNIVINLSIDGIEKQHDEIRQIPGNYEKVIKTYKKLKKLQYKNLSIGIHSVISKFNVESFSSIATHLMNLKPDSYITEIAEHRVELDTIEADISPKPVAYKSAVDFLIHRIKHSKFAGMNKITQAFRIEYYEMVKKILRDKTQIIPCYAGIASVQISPDGHVWPCCIKANSMGNLRDTDYNFKTIWKNQNFKKDRLSVKKKECHCPLANAAYTNMLMDIPTLFRVSIKLIFGLKR